VTRLVRFAVAHAKPVIGVWLVAVMILGLLGTTVEGRLSPSDIRVAGTESQRWLDLRESHYGVDVFVMLEGPRTQLDRQARRLVKRLRARRDVRVMSPFDGTDEAKRLRFGRTRLVLSVDAPTPRGRPPFEAAPAIQRAVDRTIRAPVEEHVTGPAVISVALNETVISATREAEKLAIPILVLVLLFIFRSPVAASIPLLIAVGTVVSGFGLLAVAASLRSIDAIALSTASMIGLALGVDYSLLIVSRFRELLERGDLDHREAAITAGLTAGRTAVFAGAVLLTVMSVPLLLSPGSILFSAALGAILVALVSMVGSIVVTPGVLALLGDNVNRWRLGSGSRRRGGVLNGGGRLAARPLVTAPLILALMLAIAAPAVGSRMDAPDVGQLPPENEARTDFETVRKAVGPGWSAVLDVSVRSPSRPLTDPRTLSALDRYQARVSKLPNVALVVGPGALRPAERALRRIPVRVTELSSQLRRGRRGTEQLRSGVDRGVRGVRDVRSGLGEASEGASRLAGASRAAGDGARRLATGATGAREGAVRVRRGLDQAVSGARRLRDGLADARSGAARLRRGASSSRSGARALTDGLRKARSGARQLSDGAGQLASRLAAGAGGLAELRKPVQLAETELEQAFKNLELMTAGKADPRYAPTILSVGKALAAISGKNPLTGQPAQPGYAGLDTELARGVSGLGEAATGARALGDGARELESGLERLTAGAEKLERGQGDLASGQARLLSGLSRLTRGAGESVGGLGRLADGGGDLARGLSMLERGVAELGTGVTRLADGGSRLSGGLSEGEARIAPLARGLDLIGNAVGEFRKAFDEAQFADLELFERRIPNFFDSGYLPLAAVDGARSADRRRARAVIDFDRGGQTGRVLIVPKSAPNDPATRELIDRVRPLTARLGREAGLDTAVGGVPAQAKDYLDAMSESLPLLVLAIVTLTFVGLVPIVRAIPLAVIAVLLNLLTVGAAVGVLTLAFVGEDPLLGGPGSIDVLAISTIFAITFALSIDYEVFLLSRMREEYARSGDPHAAVAYGLQGTAHVVTGAAIIMLGVFLAFSLSSFVTLRQFGVGLGVAVLLDATIVRLILLPVIMRGLGDAAWWMPRWLDRVLPNIDVEVPDPPAPADNAAPGRTRDAIA
jgi:putative drug exporter of the RND superfamily